jgi:hypothetical protein
MKKWEVYEVDSKGFFLTLAENTGNYWVFGLFPVSSD